MTLSDSTTSLESQITALTVPPGTAACVWLGQGGYLFKSPQGVTVMVDAYLSDYAEAMWGVTRAIPPVVDPGRFTPDVFLATHWHEDHLDLPVVKHYAGQPDVTLVGSIASIARSTSWGWPHERTVSLTAGESVDIGDVGIAATFARHETPEAPAPDAIGFLLSAAARSGTSATPSTTPASSHPAPTPPRS